MYCNRHTCARKADIGAEPILLALPSVRNVLSLILSNRLFKCLFNEVVKPLHDAASHLATGVQPHELNPLGSLNYSETVI